MLLPVPNMKLVTVIVFVISGHYMCAGHAQCVLLKKFRCARKVDALDLVSIACFLKYLSQVKLSLPWIFPYLPPNFADFVGILPHIPPQCNVVSTFMAFKSLPFVTL